MRTITSASMSRVLVVLGTLLAGNGALAEPDASLQLLLQDPVFEEVFIDALQQHIDANRERAENGGGGVELSLRELRRNPELYDALELRLQDIAAEHEAALSFDSVLPVSSAPEVDLGTRLLDPAFELDYIDALRNEIRRNRGPSANRELAKSDFFREIERESLAALDAAFSPGADGLYGIPRDAEGRRLPALSPVEGSDLIGDLELASTTRSDNRIYWFCPEDCLEDALECDAEIGVTPRGLSHSDIKDIEDLASLAGISVSSPLSFLASLAATQAPGWNNVLGALLQKWRQHGVTVWTWTRSETCERTSCFKYWTQLEYVQRDSGGWKKCADIHPYSPKELLKVAKQCKWDAEKAFCG